MYRFNKILGLVLFFVLFIGVTLIAETIELRTYYPAPYGNYTEMRATKLAVGSSTTMPSTDGNLNISGNVGIGTTGPGAKLDITGNDFPSMYVRSSSTVGAAIFLRSTDSNAFYQIQSIGTGVAGRVGNFEIQNSNTGTVALAITNSGGNVGIGTAGPTATLHVNGNIKAVLNDIEGGSPANMRYNSGTNEIGYDVAELFDTTEEVEQGDVLVIDEEVDNIKLRKCKTSYEKGVIGIVSVSPAILFEGDRLEIAPPRGGFTKGTKPPVALVGRILCKVSIENGPIGRGDFLTSSSTPGHAMNATDRDKSFGAIVGKALEPFSGGPNGEKTGKIMILVTLQ